MVSLGVLGLGAATDASLRVRGKPIDTAKTAE
jgi:hypothetical protein